MSKGYNTKSKHKLKTQIIKMLQDINNTTRLYVQPYHPYLRRQIKPPRTSSMYARNFAKLDFHASVVDNPLHPPPPQYSLGCSLIVCHILLLHVLLISSSLIKWLVLRWS